MTPDIRLVRDLVAEIPAFEDLYATHVFNEDAVLPHVFFWDVTQETVRSYLGLDGDEDGDGDEGGDALDWRSVLRFLEERSSRGVPEIDEVVVTSFLAYLPFPGKPGHGIVRELGPVMAAKFTAIRPGGQ